MRRLLPDGAPTDPYAAVEDLDLISLAHEDRPYVITNFVISLDGRSTLRGRSGPLGSKADTAMLVALRTRVDAVMIGAGTMRAERYGRVVADQGKRERRERMGLPHDPLLVIVTASLDLPWDAPAFTKPGGRYLIVTASEAEIPETASSVRVLRQPGGVDLAETLAYLRRERGVRALLSEGGAHLHRHLIEEDLIDELFVTHAPKLAGGEGPGLVSGLAERERPLELLWLLHEETTGELFGRYRIGRP